MQFPIVQLSNTTQKDDLLRRNGLSKIQDICTYPSLPMQKVWQMYHLKKNFLLYVFQR